MAPTPAASSSRALNAIIPLIASGQPYEAHQKARTFASRYQKSGQYDTAIDVLFQSARELLKVGQQGSGTDLTSFLLDVYENKSELVNDDSRGMQESSYNQSHPHLRRNLSTATQICRAIDTADCPCWIFRLMA